MGYFLLQLIGPLKQVDRIGLGIVGVIGVMDFVVLASSELDYNSVKELFLVNGRKCSSPFRLASHAIVLYYVTFHPRGAPCKKNVTYPLLIFSI